MMTALAARPLLPDEQIPDFGSVGFYPDDAYSPLLGAVATAIVVDFSNRAAIAVLDCPSPAALAALRSGRRGRFAIMPADATDPRLLIELADAAVTVTTDDRGRFVVEASFREISAQDGMTAIGRVVEAVASTGPAPATGRARLRDDRARRSPLRE